MEPWDEAVRDVPLSEIRPRDETFRVRVALDSGDLAAGIARDGQQVPIVLRADPALVGYQVVCGFRRLAALQQLAIPTARAVVRHGLSEEHAFRIAVIDNHHRATLGDLDRAHALVRYRVVFGKRIEELIPLFGLRQRQIIRLCKLASLPRPLMDAVAERKVHASHAVLLMERLGPDCEGDVLSLWISRIAAGLSFRELSRRLNRADRARERRERAACGQRLFRSVPGLRDDATAVRLLPVKIDPAQMTSKERALVRRDLHALLALLGDDPGTG